jgi:hypothetical protein
MERYCPAKTNMGRKLYQSKISSEKCVQFIYHECEWAFRYLFFAAGALSVWISHNVWLKLQNRFLAF